MFENPSKMSHFTTLKIFVKTQQLCTASLLTTLISRENSENSNCIKNRQITLVLYCLATDNINLTKEKNRKNSKL